MSLNCSISDLSVGVEISSDVGPFGFINFLFAKKALRLIAKTSQKILVYKF